jgi:hypothetical protein
MSDHDSQEYIYEEIYQKPLRHLEVWKHLSKLQGGGGKVLLTGGFYIQQSTGNSL